MKTNTKLSILNSIAAAAIVSLALITPASAGQCALYQDGYKNNNPDQNGCYTMDFVHRYSPSGPVSRSGLRNHYSRIKFWYGRQVSTGWCRQEALKSARAKVLRNSGRYICYRMLFNNSFVLGK